ncbi:hypothetical protein PCANC_06000 [Puccinia coronata f. sp. avenae]|uniref:Uncharacterized protein n=1 Tax=Puccinia coronata f. sp. avenae TaxID=200324 RepID=A0A2N5V1J7_9BASI|nr:hypothetical protein PCASD_05778 [Puccinia coronata f. sp. avenae]PLW53440.1 hypothetical protein PCANC_06000 [Puccinia coronata f. sp. avenae]
MRCNGPTSTALLQLRCSNAPTLQPAEDGRHYFQGPHQPAGRYCQVQVATAKFLLARQKASYLPAEEGLLIDSYLSAKEGYLTGSYLSAEGDIVRQVATAEVLIAE